MRKTMLIAALGPALLAGGIAMAQPAPVPPGGGLAFAEVAARLEGQGFLIREMERERDGYEVKATDRDGQQVRLLVDAASGQVLRREERAQRERSR